MNSQFEQQELVAKETSNIPGYIVVEGPIGVGKTTLANKLAKSFGSDLLLESGCTADTAIFFIATSTSIKSDETGRYV